MRLLILLKFVHHMAVIDPRFRKSHACVRSSVANSWWSSGTSVPLIKHEESTSRSRNSTEGPGPCPLPSHTASSIPFYSSRLGCRSDCSSSDREGRGTLLCLPHVAWAWTCTRATSPGEPALRSALPQSRAHASRCRSSSALRTAWACCGCATGELDEPAPPEGEDAADSGEVDPDPIS